jgi:glycosyltransferase involved in cell wall biosynthesis
MSQPPQFSVIIPAHNRLCLLRRALRSVWSQTFSDYEVIVVDDGSSDSTWTYLTSLTPSVKIFHQENRGPSCARNLGAARANGRYLAFLDSDDVWFPWTLRTFARLICEYDAPSILSAKLVEFSDQRELDDVRPEQAAAAFFPDYLSCSKSPYFVGAGMAVVRREAFLSSGGFIDGWPNCEDHDLILRLGSAPGFVQVLAPTTLGWRRHAKSLTADHRRTVAGVLRMVRQERHGNYPGGIARAHARRKILAFHARPASLACLDANLIPSAWQLYWATMRWNWRLARWKYLFWFPIIAIAAELRSRWSTSI